MNRPTALVTLLTLGLVPLASLNADELTFDVLFGEHAAGSVPGDMQWSPSGDRLAFTWDEGNGEALWIQNIPGESKNRVVGLEETAVDSFSWNPSGDALLANVEGNATLISLSKAKWGDTHLLTEDGSEENATHSPDGRHIAFSKDANLHLVDLDTGVERALTTDGIAGERLNATTDWVYWEEIWGRDATAFWWSPDSRKIAYYQFDESPVETYPLVNFLPTYPEVEFQRYPKAGQALPIVRLGILDLATGETTWLETGPPEDTYLARVHWRPDSSSVVVTLLNRDQDRLQLVDCLPASGACEVLLTEESPTWVNLHDDFRWADDGRFLWSSERSGAKALYLHGPREHEIRRLSPEGWIVGSVQGFNATEDWVLYDVYSADALGALRRYIWKQDLTGTPPSNLTPEVATHRALASDSSGHWVHTSSGSDVPRSLSVRSIDGSAIAALPSSAPEGYIAEALPKWEYFSIPGPMESRLPAALLKPAGFDPAQSYPVVMYHYGCPASQVVTDVWGTRGRNLWHKMMAQRGYLVLMVDNLASNFFGKTGADRAYRSFGPGNVKAQLAAVDYLKTLPYADTARIGLWGWSGGGYNTLYALTQAPGVWKAGMAGAPVSDWHLYDAIWTERYMDTPEDNPEGYATASALDAAANLEDHLLLVHGTADDNVHPQNSIAMAAKLIEAGKQFDFALHPRQKHGFRGQDARHFYERMTAFFDRHLGEPHLGELGSGEPAD